MKNFKDIDTLILPYFTKNYPKCPHCNNILTYTAATPYYECKICNKLIYRTIKRYDTTITK